MHPHLAIGPLALSFCLSTLGCLATEDVRVAELEGRLAECRAQREALEARLVAAPPAAPPAAPAAPCASTTPTPPPPSPSCFDVVLVDPGAGKLNVVKVLKTVTDKGLLEVKTLVDNPPATIRAATSREEAEAIRAQLIEAGATVTMTPVPCP